MELSRTIEDAAREALRRAGDGGAEMWRVGWVLDAMRDASSWDDARRRFLERIVRTAAADTRDDHVVRGLFLSQMLGMGVLLNAPLHCLPRDVATRERRALAVLGMIGGETTGEIFDPEQLRRSDVSFGPRAIARVAHLKTGGHWRIGPIGGEDRLRCWFVPTVDNAPFLSHPLAQSVPFVILL